MHGWAAKSWLLVLLIAAATTFSFLLLVTHARQQEKRHDHHNTRVEASCTPLERDALLAFKQGITYDNCSHLASWRLGHDCCNWTGVTCSRQSGHVIKLDLSWDQIRKQCPPSVFPPSLAGQISPSLLSLEYLEYLDLSFSDLEGPNKTFPEFLVSMTNLRYLDLLGIQFSGTVPSLLSNLTKLEYLDLSYTSFFGKLPNQLGNLSNLQYLDLWGMFTVYSDMSWLSHLQLLEYLDMSWMNLSMAVDWSHVLNSIPSIKVVGLEYCSLPSTEQSLTHLNLTKLQHVDLSENSLHQPVASILFWNSTSIESLFLSQNNLYGPFPEALGRMTNLQVLDFSWNNNGLTMSTGMLEYLCALGLGTLNLDGSLSSGNITEFVQRLLLRCSSNNFHTLSLKSNNMTGFLPDRPWHLTSLSYLDLSNNSITGSIPPGIGNLSGLHFLDLSDNYLSGAMPSNLTAMVQLQDLYMNSNLLSGKMALLPEGLLKLDISQNSLSGPLPSEFGGQNIMELIMYSNNITGHIPKYICDLESLLVLDLSNNSIDGEYPWCFGRSSIVFLLLSNNALYGNFPPSLQNYSHLTFLDLSWNNFSETLPVWIGELVYLRFLQLSHNRFFGHIPMTITNLKHLRHLNLAGNTMSGVIPSSVLSLQAMTQKHTKRPDNDVYVWYSHLLGEFKDVLSVVLKRQELKYGEGIFEMVGIDLSLNQFTGGIPEEITSLNGLLNLNLSWNHLVGQIPEKIGFMKSMESLDLSRNNFCGEIPPSLSDLKYLSYLDLSYNNLSGRIPLGRQLDTLYLQIPTMYDGNSGLCGPPLQRNCSGGSNPQPQVTHGQVTSQKYSELCFFYIGLGSGFMVGLWVVFCAMLFKKTWRIAYFRFVDRAYDKVCVLVVVTCGRLARRDDTTE